MKTWKWLAMTFMATTLATSFTACSDDDEPSNENPVLGTTGKRLVQELENGNPDNSFTYYYGTDGWLIRAISNNDPSDNSSQSITYEKRDGYTYATTTWNDGDKAECMFDNLMRIAGDATCSYDEEGHLVRYGDVTFEWENGNISKVHAHDGTTTYTYYTDLENKFPVYPDPVTEEVDEYIMLLTAHPQLFGVPCKNLVKSEVNPYATCNYTYELDSDGYVLSVTIEIVDGEDKGEKGVYFSYKWE